MKPGMRENWDAHPTPPPSLPASLPNLPARLPAKPTREGYELRQLSRRKRKESHSYGTDRWYVCSQNSDHLVLFCITRVHRARVLCCTVGWIGLCCGGSRGLGGNEETVVLISECVCECSWHSVRLKTRHSFTGV